MAVAISVGRGGSPESALPAPEVVERSAEHRTEVPSKPLYRLHLTGNLTPSQNGSHGSACQEPPGLSPERNGQLALARYTTLGVDQSEE